jgi:hypothetical protein
MPSASDPRVTVDNFVKQVVVSEDGDPVGWQVEGLAARTGVCCCR